jgi:hypothetical protein
VSRSQSRPFWPCKQSQNFLKTSLQVMTHGFSVMVLK